MAKVTVTLESAPMVNTPGLLAWAINGYKFKRDRPAMRRVFMDGYNLTWQAADDLLSGKAEHRIVGDTVQFEYDEDKYRQPATLGVCDSERWPW